MVVSYAPILCELDLTATISASNEVCDVPIQMVGKETCYLDCCVFPQLHIWPISGEKFMMMIISNECSTNVQRVETIGVRISAVLCGTLTQ